MIGSRIPFSFTQLIGVKLTWADVLEGRDRDILANDFAREKAAEELSADSSSALVELAVSDPSEPIRSRIVELASVEPSPSNLGRLLYVLIAYLRKNELQTQRLLDLVEEIYGDFNYPACLAKAVRYMPMDGPDLGSREANERRLISNLDEYLAALPES